MRTVRTVIFWAHLLTGATISLVVVTMAFTGVLLTYQRQIQQWSDTRSLNASPQSPAAALLPPAQLLERVRASDAIITGIRWRSDADAPVEILSGRERTIFVNGYTGAVLGEGSARTRRFFRTVTDVHRWLALPDSQRPIGRAITGAANLAFLFMVLSGLVLWFPRNMSRRAFRAVLLFRRGLRSKARDFNWHNVVGFWSLAPLAIIISSAVVISYAWAGALVERAAGGEEATSHITGEPPPPVERGRELELGAVLVDRARSHVDGWRSITLSLPVRDGRAVFVIDTGTGGQPHRQGELTLAAANGDVVAWKPFSTAARAERVRSLLRYTHTGEAAGIAGQTIAGLVSAGALLLVWTGLSLALRRLRAWRARRQHAVPAQGAELR